MGSDWGSFKPGKFFLHRIPGKPQTAAALRKNLREYATWIPPTDAERAELEDLKRAFQGMQRIYLACGEDFEFEHMVKIAKLFHMPMEQVPDASAEYQSATAFAKELDSFRVEF